MANLIVCVTGCANAGNGQAVAQFTVVASTGQEFSSGAVLPVSPSATLANAAIVAAAKAAAQGLGITVDIADTVTVLGGVV
jgi:hypothetical protein